MFSSAKGMQFSGKFTADFEALLWPGLRKELLHKVWGELGAKGDSRTSSGQRSAP